MMAMLRQFRRAPGRILASVFALALAVGAIGVLAIPAVSEATLHDVAAADGLGDIIVSTTPLDDAQLAAIAQLPGVAVAEGELTLAVDLADGRDATIVGLAPDRTMDLVRLVDGRAAGAPDEVVTAESVGPIGDTLAIGDRTFTIVGHGSTLWWSDADAIYTDLATASSLAPEPGTNGLAITATDDGIDHLRGIVAELRPLLASSGDALTTFPEYLPDGSTPIDADIRQISTLIGLLGIVAGLVAMVLLASTTNTLITERTREVAVMRALGGRQRPLRRRLRRIAIAITGVALVIGLPLGVVISNWIARMVLEEFVGITPDVAVDGKVLVGSALGMLLGARLVAARAARRVTRLDLAAALRDRDGAPFGRSAAHRLLTRLPSGGLLNRVAVRSSARRPARTIGVIAQISTAVGAAFLIPSLTASVNHFNSAAYASWNWESRQWADDPGLPISFDTAAPADEVGVNLFGEFDDYEVDVYGFAPETAMFSPRLTTGRWFEPATRETVVSRGFASHRGIAVGDTVAVELAAGTFDYEVVGLADDSWLGFYLDRDTLSADAGSPGMGNVVWSSASDRPATTVDVPVTTETRAQVIADESAGRAAVTAIFGAIGVIVSGVAALAVVSSMTVNLYERRHEFAAMQAIGARRRRLRGLLARELAPLGAVGVVLGLALGWLGTRGIIASFESSNSIEIGTVTSYGAIPIIVVATFTVLGLLAAVVVRSASRRPVAVTLRGAA